MEQIAIMKTNLFARAQQVHAEVDSRFGDFLKHCVSADAMERDEAARPLSREVLAEAGRLGLIGYSLPQTAGGEGHNLNDWGLALERIGQTCDDLSFTLLLGLYTPLLRPFTT